MPNFSAVRLSIRKFDCEMKYLKRRWREGSQVVFPV